MTDWKDEEQIKAELRLLTGQLKQLREELRDLVAPPRRSSSQAFLHRKGWPGEPYDERNSADDRGSKELPKPPKPRSHKKR